MPVLCFDGAVFSYKPLVRGRCLEVRRGRVVGPSGSGVAGAERLEGFAVPGFVDAHLHLEGLALASMGVDASAARSPEDVYRLVEGGRGAGEGVVYVRGAPAGVVEAVDPVLVEEAAGGAPVLVVSGCGHVAVAGPRMARRAGLEPGVYREDRVAVLVDSVLEGVGCRHALGVLEKLSSMGVTGAGFMDAGWWSISCLSRLLARRGRLPLRCSLFPGMREALRVVDGFTGGPVGGAWLRIGGVKLYADGSFSACTAALREPYRDCSGSGWLSNPEELRRAVSWALRRGLRVAVHAIGDRGIDAALEALSICPQGVCRVEHCSLSYPEHWRRMAMLGIWAVVQPGFLVHDYPWLVDRLGLERASKCYRWGGMLSAGVRLAFGSDAPVEPPNPLWGLDAVAGHRPPGYSGSWLGAVEALHAYTAAAAEASGLAWSGRLLRGYYADIVLLGCDPLEEWGSLRRCGVLGVLVGGELQAHG